MEASTRDEADPLAFDIAFHRAIRAATGNCSYKCLPEIVDGALCTPLRMTRRSGPGRKNGPTCAGPVLFRPWNILPKPIPGDHFMSDLSP